MKKGEDEDDTWRGDRCEERWISEFVDERWAMRSDHFRGRDWSTYLVGSENATRGDGPIDGGGTLCGARVVA